MKYDLDDMCYMAPDVEKEFKSNASIEDGVSGQRRIRSEYENTKQDKIQKPRSGEYFDREEY